jgi:hypothetical protein
MWLPRHCSLAALIAQDAWPRAVAFLDAALK